MRSDAVFRVGLMQLTDAAPLIVARELGFFATEDLEVSLSTEPSWANIADKLAYGLLDGAMLLPPLAIALRLGLSGSGGPEPIIVPAALSLNGNTVTLADRWAAPVRGDGAPAPAAAMARRHPPRRWRAGFVRWSASAARSRCWPLSIRFRRTTCCCASGWRRAASIPTATHLRRRAAGRDRRGARFRTDRRVLRRCAMGRSRRARRHRPSGRDIACDLEQRRGKDLCRARARRRSEPGTPSGGTARVIAGGCLLR
jgi:hypothetical protein